MSANPKSAVGLKDIYYAVLLSDEASGVPTYGPVYSLPGAKALAYNAAPALTTNFADDGAFELMESTGEKGITLTMVDFDPEHLARLSGHTYANGVITKNEGDASPYVAIWGKATKYDGSYTYVRYFKCKFGKANSEDTTREASPSPRTVTMEGRVAALVSSTYKNNYIETVRSDDNAVSATYLANFNTGVTFNAVATGAITVSAAAGTAGQVVFTFTKAGGNTNMNQASFVVPNIQIFLNSTGAVQAPTWTFGTTGGANQTVTASGCTAGASSWLVSSEVKDVNGVGVTAKGGSVTVS